MKPVLIEIGSLSFTSYGLSKALAALVAWWMIARELGRRGLDPSPAVALTLAGALGGFAGAKLYYLAENVGSLTVSDLGGTGFTCMAASSAAPPRSSSFRAVYGSRWDSSRG